MIITFNGTGSNTFPEIVSITHVHRPVTPGNREQVLEVIDRDGVYYFSKDQRSSNITFRLAIKTSSLANRRSLPRDIAAWLETADPAILTFSDEPDIIYYAVLVSPVNFEELSLRGFIEITFFIPAGCAYAKDTKTVQYQGEIQQLYLGEPTGGTYNLGRENVALTWNHYDGLTWNGVI